MLQKLRQYYSIEYFNIYKINQTTFIQAQSVIRKNHNELFNRILHSSDMITDITVVIIIESPDLKYFEGHPSLLRKQLFLSDQTSTSNSRTTGILGQDITTLVRSTRCNHLLNNQPWQRL